MLEDPLLCRFRLPFSTTVYPLGFPAFVETNSASVLKCATDSWERFSATFQEREIHLSVIVSDAQDLPELPQPVFRCRKHLLAVVCDSRNFAACDLNTGNACAFITRQTAETHNYLRDTFTDALLLPILHSQHLAVLHAACVALDGTGALLCGDSGAGKTTLAVACALRGWTLICDDASFLVRGRRDRKVVGNPYVVRFKPDARALFPFLESFSAQRRVNGKVVIQLSAAEAPYIATATQAEVGCMVLLKRTEGSKARIVRRNEDLLQHVRFPPYGDTQVIAEQEAALRSLAGIPSFELSYSQLDDAVDCLARLVRDGVSG